MSEKRIVGVGLYRREAIRLTIEDVINDAAHFNAMIYGKPRPEIVDPSVEARTVRAKQFYQVLRAAGLTMPDWDDSAGTPEVDDWLKRLAVLPENTPEMLAIQWLRQYEKLQLLFDALVAPLQAA